MSSPASASVSARKSFPAWIYITSFFVIVFIALLPLFVTLVAIGVAGANNCPVDESHVHECIIGGFDYGPDLQGAAFAIFFMLFSVPLGLLLFVIWLVVFIIHLVRAGNARKAAATA